MLKICIIMTKLALEITRKLHLTSMILNVLFLEATVCIMYYIVHIWCLDSRNP